MLTLRVRDLHGRTYNGRCNRCDALARKMRASGDTGLLAVAIGVAGKGSLDAVPGGAGRVPGLVPPELRAAPARVVVGLQVALDLGELAALEPGAALVARPVRG